jgi:hypothetical protein
MYLIQGGIACIMAFNSAEGMVYISLDEDGITSARQQALLWGHRCVHFKTTTQVRERIAFSATRVCVHECKCLLLASAGHHGSCTASLLLLLLLLQTGKSGGSLLQQALLLASAGSITGIMPVMFGVFFLMLRGWRAAVHELSQVRFERCYLKGYFGCVTSCQSRCNLALFVDLMPRHHDSLQLIV